MISARLRLVNLQAAILTAITGTHRYLSTACLHGDRDHCRSAVALSGAAKEPGTCKWSTTEVCVCPVCNH